MAMLAAGCHHNKVNNPIANVDSKQPDKVLFDRAMEAMKKGKYDVARITLQTLINTYPDSEFIARRSPSHRYTRPMLNFWRRTTTIIRRTFRILVLFALLRLLLGVGIIALFDRGGCGVGR